MQMMQQNYEKLLREAEDSHLRAMEDRKQSYEAKLQEVRISHCWHECPHFPRLFLFWLCCRPQGIIIVICI